MAVFSEYALTMPLFALRSVSELVEAGRAQGIVQELGIGIRTKFVGQPVPFCGQSLYAVVLDPGKSVQETAGLFLHKLGCEFAVGKGLAIPYYHR